jgi:very-short-patch-repair endonuclease
MVPEPNQLARAAGASGIARGQTVTGEKAARAKQLRREMTEAEQRLWTLLRGRRLDGYRFRRQQVIDGFIVDFYCHEVALVVEVDGGVHTATREYDEERDGVLRGRGISILRLTNEDVMLRGLASLNTIRASLTGQHSSPPRRQERPRQAPLSPRERGRG